MIQAVLRDGGVRSVFQPIIELATGSVVAYEALARGPQGPLERPDALFAAARAAGLLAELDEACRAAALSGASALGLVAPLTLFVNVEPEVLDTAPLHQLVRIAEEVPGDLRVVLEITERALAARPAELLRTVQRIRELGWGVALDDVGAEAASLAFMPLLRPDVVKLDLSLVQDRPGPAVAQIMNAVNAYAEQDGAVVLAEGIETEAHVRVAESLGATLGQGWFFARPAAGPVPGYPVGELVLPAGRPATTSVEPLSPFACLPETAPLRRASKALLVEVSKQLEREALRLGETCVVASTFQESRHLTPATRRRYRELVDRVGFVCALGEGLSPEPLPGLRGADLGADDPVRGEWDLVVLAPHFSAALLARDLGDDGPDMERTFEFALTYERDTVVRAAHALLSRVAPRRPDDVLAGRGTPAAGPPGRSAARAVRVPVTAGGEQDLLQRALSATTNGVTIVDMLSADQELVYVNEAFERLTGLPREALLGRNCRFLQGPGTDPGAVRRMAEGIARGTEVRETVLNHRGPERTPWWNEVHLAPVADADGRVVQYIGVQNDVTARVEAEQELACERDRAHRYLQQIEQLAWSDPLTGLMNRRRLEQRLEDVLADARTDGTGLALLFLDLDGFKAVNDELGHAAGDELLQLVGGRLASRVRQRDLLARLGGDEFLVALVGLDAGAAQQQARRVAAELEAVVAEPVVLAGRRVEVATSVGVAVHPVDGTDFASLLHTADQRMYAHKHRSRSAAV
jgi:diguanylate cyclase (GGDEF)-like protein/PAS domain S-box-containing protein